MASADRSVDWAMAKMTRAGAFGPDARFVSFALDGRHAERNQFATTVLYGTVTVRDGDGARAHRLVIKTKHPEPELRRMFKSDLQFGNEILFYGRMAPFLADVTPAHGRQGFCRYFYGINCRGDLAHRDVVVLENENPRGYRSAPSDHPLFLDFDHVVVALRTLAKFHAMSYRAKYTDRSKFMEIIDGIEDSQWNAEGEWMLSGDGVEKLLAVVLDRLAERCGRGGDDELLRRFRTELLADWKRNLRRTTEPAEPLAVLCHGEFLRNNLLFRYGENGKPVDAVPIDMATIRYGSPALDLSFFLYMNTGRRLRDARWDLLLDEYCATLAAAVSDLTGPDFVPDRARVDAEMRERAFCGVAQASFFVRLMMKEPNMPGPAEFARMDADDFARNILKLGGDEATDVIADAVQHFISIKYAGVPAVPPTTPRE